MLDTKLQHNTKNLLKNSIVLLLKMGITANQITILGLIFGVGSATAIILDHRFIALLLLYLSGLCDILDGIIAREQGGGSSIGTLLDIVFDRIVEVSIILALAYTNPSTIYIMILLLASILICISVFLTVGILVNKSSHKTFFYAPGIMERTEAFILFTLLILLPQYIIIVGIIGALLIFITGIQRFILAIKHLN